MASPVFGKYETIRRLAVGGMGEIFLARQTGVAGFDRLAILKSLLPDLAEDERFVDQFLDEARVAATLNHPHLVAIYEVGLWEGIYFIAMEYIHGISLSALLREAIKRQVEVPPSVAARIAHDAAVALDHAHHAKSADGAPLDIVHRDISPQNIMVRDDGITKVVDFGIAKAADRSSRTATGELKGKLRYMPPEQLRGQPLDGRSDQFALGVVFWELCTRLRLFKEDNQIKILRQVEEEGLRAPSYHVADFPKDLDQVVMRMLSKEAEQRFARCRDVAEALAAGRLAESSEVAAFVQRVGGDKIDAVTSDLTPSQDNFVISFTPSRTDATTPMRQPLPRVGRKRSKKSLWLGAATAIGVVAAIVGAAMLGRHFSGNAGAAVTPVSASAQVDAGGRGVGDPGAEPKTGARLLLRSTPSGAVVRTGSQLLGPTPLDTEVLEPGVEHTLVVSRHGHVTQRLALTLSPGETRDMEVTLRKRGSSRQPVKQRTGSADQKARRGKGSLSVNTKPWTSVSIDGRSHGTTPLIQIELSSGVHSVVLKNPAAGIDERRRVRIEAGKNSKLNLDLRSGP